jgi:hypothetical protein
MMGRWAFLGEVWWYWFRRSTAGPVYACLIWNATLRKVL